MREKIIKVLENLRWGEYLPEEQVADQIISTLIESLPEEIDWVKDIPPILRDSEMKKGEVCGWNMYRERVINLLRGTK